MNNLFKEIHENNFYNLFEVPSVYFYDLFDAEPIFIKHINREATRKNTLRQEYFSFGAIRQPGDMFTYGRDIVPIHISFTRHYTIDKKLDYTFCNFSCLTIDDGYMGLCNSVYSKKEELIFFNKIKDFLNTFTKLPDNETFEKYFNGYGTPNFN